MGRAATALQGQTGLVLAVIANEPNGITASDVPRHLEISYARACVRIDELVEEGFVEACDQHTYMATAAGRLHVVEEDLDIRLEEMHEDL